MTVDFGKCLRCWEIRLQVQTVTKEALHVCPESISRCYIKSQGRPCDSDVRENVCQSKQK